MPLRYFGPILCGLRPAQNDPQTAAWAKELAEERPDRFAALAQMLLAIRENEIEKSIAFVEDALKAAPLRRANELQRAEAALRFFAEKGLIPAGSALVRARLLLATENRQTAFQVIDSFLTVNKDSSLVRVAERLRKGPESQHSGGQP